MPEQITYFVPGPTFVPAEALDAQTKPLIGHRSPAYQELHREAAALLDPVFRTEQPVMIAPASGTLVMEMAVASLAPNRILHLVCGGFSERWLEISQSRGVAADALEVPWGEGADLDDLRAALRKTEYDAVTVTHSETSTGVLNPLQEIATIVHGESDALVLADCVSSLAGAPMEFDEWGIDLALAGVQKALATPPGVAVFAASQRAMDRAAQVPNRGYYTDLARYRQMHDQDFTITTPAIPVIRALLVQLERIGAEGIEARWQRHAELHERTEAWADDTGFTYASAEGVRSPTVSCLQPPQGITAAALLSEVSRRGFTLGPGYGKWAEGTFRLGHMGEVQMPDLEALFDVIEDSLSSLGGGS